MLIDWCHVGFFFVIIPVQKFLIILQVFFRHFYFISLFASFLSSLLICFCFRFVIVFVHSRRNSPRSKQKETNLHFCHSNHFAVHKQNSWFEYNREKKCSDEFIGFIDGNRADEAQSNTVVLGLYRIDRYHSYKHSRTRRHTRNSLSADMNRWFYSFRGQPCTKMNKRFAYLLHVWFGANEMKNDSNGQSSRKKKQFAHRNCILHLKTNSTIANMCGYICLTMQSIDKSIWFMFSHL